MMADTVKITMLAITTIHPIKAIGRLKIFRSGLRSMKGSAASSAINAPGKRNGAKELPELAGKNLEPQQLKEEQKIPLRLRMIIARIGRRLFKKHHRLPKGQGADADKDHRHPDDVFPDLPRKKIVGLRLQLFRRAAEGTGRTRLAEQENDATRPTPSGPPAAP